MSEFEYIEPPENLVAEVRGAVDFRLKYPDFAKSILLPAGYRAANGDIVPVPAFALTTQQPISIKRLHRMRDPSSWSFQMELLDDSGTPVYVFSTAGPSSRGYRYSSILNMPDSQKLANILVQIADNAGNNNIAFLQVPTYYLEAFWIRTEDPANDVLYFTKPTFGVFNDLGIPVPLSALVKYLNKRLDKGGAAPTSAPLDSAD